MSDSPVGQSEARPSVILDVDRAHFDQRVKAIKKELAALDNLYLSPRIKGALRDLGDELDAISAEREAGL